MEKKTHDKARSVGPTSSVEDAVDDIVICESVRSVPKECNKAIL